MVWYVDPVNGNANYAGSSFALQTSGTDGVANGTTTFTSISANFTSGMVGQRINIGGTYYTVASFVNSTTITLSATRATATGLSFWVGGALQYHNQVGSAALGIAAGDTMHTAKTADPLRVQDLTGANATATWTNKGTVVMDTACWKTVNACETAWTADNSSTTGTSTTRKEGSNSATISTSAVAQLRAHAATANTDFSSCQKVSGWIQSSVTQSANTLRIDLCSDTGGTTPVHSFTIPFIMTIGNWYLFEFDNGSALSSNINSVALHTLSGIASATITIDNIIAGNRLTHGEMISKDSAATIDATTDGWWPIRSLGTDGQTITIDTGMASSASTASRGYYGTTSSTTAVYARQVYYMNAITIAVSTPTQAGTSSNPITVIGGYDTGSDTRTGETWWGLNGATGTLMSINQNWNIWSHMNFKGGSTPLTVTGSNYTFRGSISHSSGNFTLASAAGPNTLAIYSSTGQGGIMTLGGGGVIVIECLNNYSSVSTGISINNIVTWILSGNVNLSNCTGNGLSTSSPLYAIVPYGTTITCSDNASNGIGAGTGMLIFEGAGTVVCNNNASSNGLAGVFRGNIGRITTTGNSGGAISISAGTRSALSVGSCNLAESTKISHSGSTENSYIAIEKYQDTAGDTRFISSLGTVQTDTTTRHTASGYSWKSQPNASATSTYPLAMPLQSIGVDNTSTTFTCYVYRTSVATLNAAIKYFAGDLLGSNSDASGTAAGAVNTWEQLSMSIGAGSETTGGLTPYLLTWGDSSNPAYFDDAGAT